MMKALMLLPVVALAALAATGGDEPREAAVAAVLDELHAAAAAADGERYFALFAPEAVFLGTDATERWPIEAFRSYASARFDTGTGWTYHVVERHVSLSDGGDTAWFDERLHNERYGECRGTGVLVRRGGRWRIAQYSLTFPIPNEIALDVVRMVREATSRPGGG